MKKKKTKTRLVRICEDIVKEVEVAALPTKTPIGYYFELAAKEKLEKTKIKIIPPPLK